MTDPFLLMVTIAMSLLALATILVAIVEPEDWVGGAVIFTIIAVVLWAKVIP